MLRRRKEEEEAGNKKEVIIRFCIVEELRDYGNIKYVLDGIEPIEIEEEKGVKYATYSKWEIALEITRLSGY